MKTQFINLIQSIITEEIGLHNTVSAQSKGKLTNYIAQFNDEVDQLIAKFFYVNTVADNGGAPVLKQILKVI